MNKQPLWTKDFIYLWMANFLMAGSFYLILPTLPVYAEGYLKLNNADIGYIIGFFTITALIMRLIAGHFVDTLGRKIVYLPALFLFAILMSGYAFVQTLILLFALRLLHGVSWGFATTANMTVASDIIPAERRGEGIGYFTLSMTIAMALAPAIAFYVVGVTTYQNLFFLAMLVALVAFGFASLVRYADIPKAPHKFSLKGLIEKRALGIALIMLFYGIVYGGIVSFITVFGAGQHLSNPGLFFLIYALALGVVRPLSGIIMDRQGPRIIMGVGLVTMIAGFFWLSQANGEIHFLIAAAMIGIGSGIALPVIFTMALNIVEPQRRGAANATVFSAMDMGIGLGSVVLGYVAQFTSLSVMYIVCAAVLIVPLLYFYLVEYGIYKESIKK